MQRIIFLLLTLLCFSDPLQAQSDTYLQRETFGLSKSNGWDIQEYEPGKYLTLLDGKIPNSTSHEQIGFLGKHESNGIAYAIDSFNYGVLTLGFKPKLYQYNNCYFTYTRGTSQSVILKYDIEVDSLYELYTIEADDFVSKFNDICPVSSEEVYALYDKRIEDSFMSSGYVVRVKNGVVVDSFDLIYPTSPEASYGQRIIYNNQSGTLFLLSRIIDEVGINSFERSYIQEYSTSGDLLWDYATPVLDFHQFYGHRNFYVDPDREYLYLAGKGSIDLVGWLLKIEIATGNFVWKKELSVLDSIDGNKQGLINHMQLSSDDEFFILSGAFLSNDKLKFQGFISKISLDGVIHWTRTFLSSENDSHEFEVNSIRPTSDGGYIATGRYSIKDGSSETPFAALIIKVDKDGLIDGISSSIDEVSFDVSDVDYFSLYPNPISDLLNIRQLVDDRLTYSISDNYGKLIDQFSIIGQDMNKQIDVSNYPKGNYVITVSNSRQLLKSELFVVGK